MEKSYEILNSISTVGDLKKYLSILDDKTPLNGRFYKFEKENIKEKVEGYEFTFSILNKKKK